MSPHHPGDSGPVQLTKLRPFGYHYNGVCATHAFIRVGEHLCERQHPGGIRNGDWIACRHDRAHVLEVAKRIGGCGLTDVVCSRLECEAESGESLAREVAAQRLLDLRHESRALLRIHLHRRPKQPEAVAVIARRLIECARVLGEAGAAKAESGAEKGTADARLGTDAIRNGLHVGAGELTRSEERRVGKEGRSWWG